MKITVYPSLGFLLLTLTFLLCGSVAAQEKKQIVRMAKLVIDSVQLENYRAALSQEMEAAVRLEQGVLSLDAVYEKNNPTHVIVLEVYASDSAYAMHRQTAHFKKYKDQTKDMVKALDLVEVVAIDMESKR